MPEPRKPAKAKGSTGGAKKSASTDDIRALLRQAAADLAGGTTPTAEPVAPKQRPAKATTSKPRTTKPRTTNPKAAASPEAEPPSEGPWHTVRSPAAHIDLEALDREFEIPSTAYPHAAAPTPDAAPTPPSFPNPAPARERRSRRALIAVAMIVVLGLVAGGIAVALSWRDDSPSKAEYIADADDICRPANGPVAAIVKPTSYPELATASSTVVTSTEGQLNQLRRLDQPSGDDGVLVDGVIASFEGTVRAARKLKDAAGRADDAATISATNEGRAAFTDTTTKAMSFGFGACGTGLQSGIDAVFGGSQAVIKTGFVARAEAACRAAVRKTDEVEEPRGTREVSRYFDQIADVFDGVTAELKALAVPPGDEAVVVDMIAAIEKVNTKGRDYFDAIADEDEARVLATEKELNTLQTAADAKLDAYGLGVCGSNFGGE